ARLVGGRRGQVVGQGERLCASCASLPGGLALTLLAGQIYTNWKVQAGFYHLSLARLLSAIPLLVPSHELSFLLSRDPLSPASEERPLALRTVQAFVEHHLFVLLSRWLDAVTEEEWSRLQEGLRPQPETPTKGKSASQNFLEKLQTSVKTTLPPTPGRARRRPSSAIKPVLAGANYHPHKLLPLLRPPSSTATCCAG
ncbi:hypothetical protein DMC30DRAFT_450513, partial [Rhodotorula diobovata]